MNLEELLKSPSPRKPFITVITYASDEEAKLEMFREERESSFYTDTAGRTRLNDGTMANLYHQYNEMVYANGAFYCPDGMKRVGMVEREILETIQQRLTLDLARNTKKVLEALKVIAYKDDFDFTDQMIIPFANGDMVVDPEKMWTFYEGKKRPVPYRLPVSFKPMWRPQPTPNFAKWLDDLFYPEDIPTLQEYLGYCLLPTTRGQKLLFIIGEAGCGKSIIVHILKALFGETMTAPLDLNQFFEDKFKVAELENQLVFYEDDLSDQALDDSTKFKKFATGGVPVTADRKFGQPFKFTPYCRFIFCGNHMLKCPSDDSDGFYRRLMPISTKPKDPDRVNIPAFGDIVASEAEGILQWALLGLKRLIENDWQFTVSNRSTQYVRDFRDLSNPLPLFMEDCFVRDEAGDFTNDELRMAYSMWCIEQGIKPMQPKRLTEWLFDQGSTYGLVRENNGNLVRGDKRKRGYKGGYIRKEYLISHTVPV